MHKIPDSAAQHEGGEIWPDESQESVFEPLSSEQAREWRESQPQLSMWRLVGFQALVGLMAGLLGWLFTQRLSVAWSVWYGSAAVTVPTALMVYGVTSSGLSRMLASWFRTAFAAFLFWEGVKVVLVVLLMGLARSVVSDLSWLGLLAGVVVSLKVYWFGFLIQARRSNVNG
jgi:ATP synthase protein I